MTATINATAPGRTARGTLRIYPTRKARMSSKHPRVVSMEWIARDLGLALATIHTYNKRARRNRRAGTPKRGDLPEPDEPLGRKPGWRYETYQRWKTDRPGPGRPKKK